MSCFCIVKATNHYENKYIENIKLIKNFASKTEKNSDKKKNLIFFHITAQNMDYNTR